MVFEHRTKVSDFVKSLGLTDVYDNGVKVTGKTLPDSLKATKI